MSTEIGRHSAESLETPGASFIERFVPLARRLFGTDSAFVDDLDRKLGQAHMPNNVELYLALAVFSGLMVGGMLWVLGAVGAFMLVTLGFVDLGPLLGVPVSKGLLPYVEAARFPILVIGSGLVFGAIGAAIGFGSVVSVPYLRAGERKREINLLLPDAIAYMYALSLGGMNQIETMEALAEAEDTYGEIANEFEAILKETEYFDTDYRTAIENQADRTPSEELSQFLTDMLSISNSGGDMTDFLDDAKEKHLRTAKRQQEETLDVLELFGEVFLSLSVFPVLLLIILLVMRMLGAGSDAMLYLTVYGLIPVLGAMFLILIYMMTQTEPNDGYIDEGANGEDTPRKKLFDRGPIERFSGMYPVFDHIKRREGTLMTEEILRRPHIFFRDHPLTTLWLTVPAALVMIGYAVLSGMAPTTYQGMIDNPIWGTFVYVYLPIYVVLVPLMVFRLWNRRHRYAVLDGLSDQLRKLANTNATGLTVLESIRTVADTSRGKLARELDVISKRVTYGMRLRDALIEFNNRYHIPRLARTTKLISKSQETSNQIAPVFQTAAAAAEAREELVAERTTRTRMQIVVIMMTFFTLLAVMAILKLQFLGVLAGLVDQVAGSNNAATGGFAMEVNPALLSLLFFHAVTLQAILAGLVSGVIKDGDLLAGVHYVVALSTVALVVWMGVA